MGPSPYPPYQPYWGPPVARPDAPSSTTAFVLGVVAVAGGFMFCGLPLILSPFAWHFGSQALREIEESGGTLGGESQARAGQIMGIVGTALLGLAVLGLVIALVVAGITST
jgi:hypothetical protein